MSQSDAPRTKSGDLKHTCNPDKPGYPLPFGRRGENCARCDELAAGAAPRALPYDPTKTRKADDEQRSAEIRAHFQSERHLSGGCGPVCTFGEW
jgi:hypothetical protein